MVRKIKQKGESAILHWTLRKGFSDKVIQDQGHESCNGALGMKSISVRGISKFKGPALVKRMFQEEQGNQWGWNRRSEGRIIGLPNYCRW